jgi:hypothetical protein
MCVWALDSVVLLADYPWYRAMSLVSTPVPASGTFLKSVKQSCRDLRVSANVKVSLLSLTRMQ